MILKDPKIVIYFLFLTIYKTKKNNYLISFYIHFYKILIKEMDNFFNQKENNQNVNKINEIIIL